jgi:hypothetical protein
MQRRWRGGDDPSGYGHMVADELWEMRLSADLTLREMAAELTRELVRTIDQNRVFEWESGIHKPGADVYRAYITVAGAARPLDNHADPRLNADRRVAELERRFNRLAALVDEAEGPEPTDLVSPSEAAAALNVSKQTIHNYVNAGAIRSRRRGVNILVSLSDARAERDRRIERTPGHQHDS